MIPRRPAPRHDADWQKLRRYVRREMVLVRHRQGDEDREAVKALHQYVAYKDVLDFMSKITTTRRAPAPPRRGTR